MKLTHDQKLWLLTADPITHELAAAPEPLVRQCSALGLVARGKDPGTWRLSAQGHAIWRDMLENPP